MRFDACAAGPPDGPLVLLLHGWPQFANSWSPVLDALGADGYRTVAVDQRGYSPEARPEGIASYAVDELVQDTFAFADALERERFHLVAHDWGAIVGWALAAASRGRLASYTSLATPHPSALSSARLNDADQRAKSAYVDFFRLPGGVAEKALLGNGAARLRAIYGGIVSPEHVEANIARLREPGAMTAVLNWYRAFDFDDSIGRTKVPVRYVWGSADLALGERAARATVDYATGPYQLDVLEGASHWLVDEVPERVIAAVREHLTAYPVAT